MFRGKIFPKLLLNLQLMTEEQSCMKTIMIKEEKCPETELQVKILVVFSNQRSKLRISDQRTALVISKQVLS